MRLLVVVILVALWEAIFQIGLFGMHPGRSSLLPYPSGIAGAASEWLDGGIQLATAVSLSRAAAGFLSASALGVAMGLLTGISRFADATFGTVLRILQPVPGVAWIPFVVVWFGSTSEAAVIFIAATGAFFPVAIATASGVQQVPPSLRRAAQTLGVSGMSEVHRVLLPSALPNVLSGLRVGWAFCWRALIGAEMILATEIGRGVEGYGGLLNVAGAGGGDAQLAGLVLVLLAAIGLLVDLVLFGLAEERVLRSRGLRRDNAPPRVGLRRLSLSP